MAKGNIVSEATTYLRGLSRRRSNGLVTADDVVMFLNRKKVRMTPTERLSVTRSVLGEPNFFAVGSTRSTRPEARSRTITTWSAE